jgi:myosin heavy subunit
MCLLRACVLQSQQYVQGHIYTETGTFTTAVNPYRIMSELYSDEARALCTQRKRICLLTRVHVWQVLRRYNDIGRSAGSGREAHAHVYGVADNAFRSMIRELEISRTPADQVILISGESGAG